MHFAVIGVGGVGGYFGARLAEAGHDVTFIARGEQLRALRTHGLRVTSHKGDLHLSPVHVEADPQAVGVVDCVIVAVKAWQVADTGQAIRPMVGERTMVLPLQNGVEASDTLAAILGEEPVLNGLCGILAWRDGPGHIRHFAIEPVVRFGERNNERTARIDDLQRAFDVCVGAVAEVPTTFELPCGTSFFSFARKAALVLSPGRL